MDGIKETVKANAHYVPPFGKYEHTPLRTLSNHRNSHTHTTHTTHNDTHGNCF
jgi:hypothetical protein